MKKRIAKKIVAFLMTVIFITNLMPLDNVEARKKEVKYFTLDFEDDDYEDEDTPKEESDVKESDVKESNTEESSVEKSSTEESSTKESSTEKSSVEESESESCVEESPEEESEISTNIEESDISIEDENIDPESEIQNNYELTVEKGTDKFELFNGEYSYVVNLKAYLNKNLGDEEIEEQDFKYKIYKYNSLISINSQETLLYEENFKCGKGIENSKNIKYRFNSAGYYAIKIFDKDDNFIESFMYNILKNQTNISLKNKSISLSYGEKINIQDVINIVNENDNTLGSVKAELFYDVKLQNDKDKDILNIVLDNQNNNTQNEASNYIEVIGMNAENSANTTVKIKIKETPFTYESNEVELKINIVKLKPEISITTISEANAYDNLNVNVSLKEKGNDITKEILKNKAFIAFKIQWTSIDGISFYGFAEYNNVNTEKEQTSESKEYIDSRDLQTNENGEYIIPITSQYFSNMTAKTVYKITATLMYDEDKEAGIYAPFDFVSSETEVSVKGSQIGLQTSLEKDGQFDYRSDYGKTSNLTVTIADAESLNKDSVINYQITSNNTDIIDEKENKEYTNKSQSIPLVIKGAGTTQIYVKACLNNDEGYIFDTSSMEINVSNSSFCDDDIIIVYKSKNNNAIEFICDENGTAIKKWKEYLQKHNSWINGNVYVKLSDSGKYYYDKVCVNNGKCGEEAVIGENSDISEYILWTEHTKRNTSTNRTENGTRSFVMGIDNEGPVSDKFNYSQNYFEPTKTDKCNYYASDFSITGSFSDELSGVSKVEYTTNYNEEHSLSDWREAEISDKNSSKISYNITLGNGDYKAIAVRAYDNAGNVSDVQFLKNEADEFINIIVDDSEPKINVEAYIDGIIYDSENENWTNKAINYVVSCDKAGTSIAGIYSCEYAYKTILDFMNGDTDYNWKTVEVVEDDKLENVSNITIGKDKYENKNGYYYFQAVSKSGVKTSVPVKKRILLQQIMPKKKPVIVTNVLDSHKDEWYNKKSGTPIINFEYPDYDNGSVSGEYEAPVILHYNLLVKDENGNITELKSNETAMKGVNKKEDLKDGKFNVTEDNLENFKVDFEFDKNTGYAKDGIYTLEYWISDKASNESEKEKICYKIDCHEPTELMVKISDIDMKVDSEETILYQNFYQKTVNGSSSAEYGISGKGSLKILKAKKIGEWQTNTSFEDGESFEISANNRCFIYVEATDKAGNKTQGWTRGVVVDDLAPEGNGSVELILEPKGANEHGFYNKDIEVEVSIKDAPDNDDCAALMNVTSSVGKDGNDTVSGKELFKFAKELPTNEELSNAQSFNSIQIIDAKVNESNNAYIDVTAVDRSGNEKTSTQVLKIDVTKPQIDITFDNNDAINESYFNSTRVATIHVNELNFNPKYVNIEVTRDGLVQEVNLSEWTSTENEHYASMIFAEDGDYTLSVSCKDLADNESETVRTQAFTIDKTLPVADIRFEGNVSNEIYYSSQVKAVITITEHNFNEKEFMLKLLNNDAVINVSNWTHKGNEHTAKAVFNNDGNYNLVCEYADMAGNSLESQEVNEFVIDTISPQILIKGVSDESANSGEVIPVVTVSDLNVNQTSTDISLKTGKGELVELDKLISFTENEKQKNCVYTLADVTSKEDNIYYLTVSSKDLAGNENILTYRFSLNRYGSTYDINDFKELTEKYYNSYSAMNDLVIYEMNVDKVEDFNIFISKNGEMLSGKEIMLKSDIDASVRNNQIAYSKEVSGDENTGYTYKYTIYKENFKTEGTYRMGLYSKDKAGNEVNNTLEVNGEDICFVIDATQPKVVIEGIESGKIYDTIEHTVNVMVSDNFKLNEAQFVLVNSDGDELQSWDYYEFAKNEGDVVTLTIPQYNEEVSLLFRAKDAAGNEILTLPDSKTAVSDVLITTDKWVQIINKPSKSPLLIGIMLFITVALITYISILYMYLKKRRLK